MNWTWKGTGVLVAVMCLLTSCFTPKKVLYLQDMDEQMVQTVTDSYEAKIRKDDLLQIQILSRDPEAAKPFNLSAISSEMTTTVGNNQEELSGYLVDTEGNIEIPVLGQVHVAGLTRRELRDLLVNRLVTEQLLKDPVVNIRIQNFRIAVLGEVSSPGAIEVKGERMTVLQALAEAGDLTAQGRRDRVAVIREADGKRQVHYLDLKSKKIFDSPYFYLQQNDVVYVEPNDAKSVQYRSGQMGNVTPWISLVSSVLSLATLIFAIK